MKNSNQNINIESWDLPQRLKSLREDRHWSQSDLAKETGLSYRTIHDLELGKRNRIQEKTLMLLAQAFEITLPELTGIPNGNDHQTVTTDKPRNHLPWKWIAPVLLALLLAAGLSMRHWALTHARWEIRDHHLVVRDGVLGSRLWEIGAPPGPKYCLVAPWSDRILILGFSGTTPRGRNIMALDRSSGRIIWTAQPDLAAVRAAFGPDVLSGGNLFCENLLTVDLNRDGRGEILALFHHTSNYPGILCWIDQDGRLLGQYANHGQFNDILETDLDGDGRNEIIASGTDNAPVYAGATVVILDEDHFRGASVDSLNHPRSLEPDSCLVRLVVPNWPQPYMTSLQAKRFHARKITVYTDPEGRKELAFEFGPINNLIGTLRVDRRLVPLGLGLQDYFIETLAQNFPPELITDTGPTDPAWLATWLAGYLRFGAVIEQLASHPVATSSR